MRSVRPSLPYIGADVLQRIFPGSSEMAKRMRSFDWQKTVLGVPEAWPQSLKISLRIMLTSRQPMAIWWGEHFINLYNDSYAAFLCGKHPAALGQPASTVWSEDWEKLGPRAEFARSRDEETYDEAQPFILLRNGYPEETYLTISYTPIPNDDGGFGGLFCSFTDEMQGIIDKRHSAGHDLTMKPGCARILVVDDNADLRSYLVQLLASRWTVEAAPDGKVALDMLRREHFDLVLTDVMMPHLDGFGLLHELRADPTLEALPVIMLSARTGEETRIEGLHAGADDYLIKPFSAREVVARVETHLKLSAARRHLADENAALLQLHEVNTRLISEEALPTLLQAVVDAAITVSGADKGSLQLYDAASQTLRIVAQKGFQQAFLDQFAVLHADDATVYGDVLRRNEQVLVEDVTQNPFFLEASTQTVMTAAGVRAVHCMPLRARAGSLLGVLTSYWSEPQHPSETALRILDLLAQQATDLIEHRQRDAALRESQEQLLRTQQHLQAIMQAVPVGISFSDDPSCQRITGNPAVLAQFEVSSEDNLSASAAERTVLGRQVQFFRNGKEIAYAELPLQRAVAENREIPPMELEVLLPSGRHWFAEASGAPIRNAEGQIIGGVAVTVDITKRKQAEEISQAHQQLLETIIYHLPVAVCIIRGSDLRLQLINPSYQAVAPGKEMIGKTLDELWPETDQHFENLCRQVLSSGEPYHAVDEMNMIQRAWDRSPEPAYFTWSLFRIRLPGDAGWGILNTAWETTDRKNAEEALRQAVERYEQQVRLFEGITSTTPDFVYLFDPEGRFVYANRRLLEVWGMALADVIGKTCLELGYEQWHHDMHMREIAQVIETKQPIKGEVPFKAPLTGIYGVYEYIFTPVIGPDGKVEFVAGTTRDVTERKHAEEALIESEARFQLMADGAPIFLWVSGTDKLCTYFNKPWLEFTGRTMEQELGNGWTEGVHPDDIDHCMEIYTRSFDARQPFTMEYRLRRYDGEYRWLLDSGVPLYGPSEKFMGYIGSCLDISERKQMEEALREADRCKDEFLATLAHELRNPLAPLRNALHVLRLSGGDTRVAEHTYAMMDRQVNHLVRLVDDLLEVSRITRGKIELKQENVELATIIRSAVETSQPLIEAAQHRFIVSLPEEPLLLYADPVRLTQVFANLLNNAAKYMEPGGDIRLTAWRESGSVIVSVQDMGVGISADALPHVFDLFTQIDRSAGRAQGGLGIGLALAHSLVQLHGGSISAHSQGPGQGSEFIVRLPLITRPGDDAVETQPTALRSLRRILIVDDNRDAADSLGLLLKFLGAEIHVVYDGPAALEALDSFKPAVVLLDIGMPRMDGYEVARKIRQQPRFRNVTLIALTGWGQAMDRYRTQEAGFDYHLTKPADIDALQALLASLENRDKPPD